MVFRVALVLRLLGEASTLENATITVAIPDKEVPQGDDIYRSSADLHRWSFLGCYALADGDAVMRGDKGEDVLDRACVKAGCDAGKAANEMPKCRSGFPFYRFWRSDNCLQRDCLSGTSCKLQCLSKGLDVAALVYDQVDGVRADLPKECRCGASQRLAVWKNWHQLSDHSVEFDTIRYLLPPDKLEQDTWEEGCQIEAWQFEDESPSDGTPPLSLLDVNAEDVGYQLAIIIGADDVGEIEDSAPDDDDMRTEAVRSRRDKCLISRELDGGVSLALKDRTRMVRRRIHRRLQPMEKDAQGVPYAAKGECRGVTEHMSCWQRATKATGCGETCGVLEFDTKYRRRWCGREETDECPITCGKCRLYNRSPQNGADVPLWLPNKGADGQVSIPFMFDPGDTNIDSSRRTVMREAAAAWREKTCVNFYEASPTTIGNRARVVVKVLRSSSGVPSGCSAGPLGYPSGGQAFINLGSCSDLSRLGSVVHELGHILGMVHTQMRGDRNKYLDMIYDNVKPTTMKNFAIRHYSYQGVDGQYSPYDYGSIMHYTKTQGMIAEKYDPRTNPGVFTLKGQYEPGISEVGQREHLSDLDVAEINALYSCRVSSATTPPPPRTVVRQQPSTASRSTSEDDTRLAELEVVEQRLRADEVTIAQRVTSAVQEAANSGGRLTTAARDHLLSAISGIQEMYKKISQLGDLARSLR
ncbi:hypothetical protein FOZ63_031146 [Perkinsus olseni]|uniref:Metalloendopeptidase n=1 Tax=Perkinsus olseni TaxID=32597 RepID=A0A7J6UGI7_PEROL|nr:hypothetical protein FOZ63_031146 [Perkinsus olseni]